MGPILNDSRTLGLWYAAMVLGAAVWITGCSSVQRVLPHAEGPYPALYGRYEQARIGMSTSMDVRPGMRPRQAPGELAKGEEEVLYQSEAILGLEGRVGQGQSSWFYVVVFDPTRRTAQRKYLFFLDEKARFTPTEPRRVLVPNRRVLVFRGEVALPDSGRTGPVAALEYIAGALREDAVAVTAQSPGRQDTSNALNVCAMLMNQVFRDALLTLGKNPGAAANLAQAQGVSFEHTSLDKGRVRVVLTPSTAVVEIDLGIPPAARAPAFSGQGQAEK